MKDKTIITFLQFYRSLALDLKLMYIVINKLVHIILVCRSVRTKRLVDLYHLFCSLTFKRTIRSKTKNSIFLYGSLSHNGNQMTLTKTSCT